MKGIQYESLVCVIILSWGGGRYFQNAGPSYHALDNNKIYTTRKESYEIGIKISL